MRERKYRNGKPFILLRYFAFIVAPEPSVCPLVIFAELFSRILEFSVLIIVIGIFEERECCRSLQLDEEGGGEREVLTVEVSSFGMKGMREKERYGGR